MSRPIFSPRRGRGVTVKLENNDGSLMYVAQCTRADISFAISKISRFTSNSSVEPLKAIGKVLGYLKNTKELSLQYSKCLAILERYSDAS